MKSRSGFTLMELMVAVVILMVALTGLIATYVSSFDLNETARNLNYAMMAAQEKMEQIRNYAVTNFSNVIARYNNDPNYNTFEIADFYPAGASPIASGDSKGKITVTRKGDIGSEGDLLEITITVCWRQRGGRVIGGDSSLVPSANSPARLVTLITNRK